MAFTLLLLAAHPALGQDQYRAQGDSLRLAGNLSGAISAYYQSMAQAAPPEDLFYAIASTYALAPQYADSAFRYLHMALQEEDSMKPLWDADFYFLVGDDRWTEVERIQLDKLAIQVSGAFDRVYARRLLQMRMREWGFRYQIMLGYRTLPPNSPILSALAAAMQEHHVTNQTQLQHLLDQKGWPMLSTVGREAAYAAGNVLNHADLATRQYYLPLLESACENGEADWSRYAHILDRTELELGRPQVYGTQMVLNEETQRYELQQMIDATTVDVRRAKKGMEPIAEQLERFNASMQRDFGSAN
ncbi:MAG: hypothetical protein RhofKO_26390 [Rhodothermales bacterium]